MAQKKDKFHLSQGQYLDIVLAEHILAKLKDDLIVSLDGDFDYNAIKVSNNLDIAYSLVSDAINLIRKNRYFVD